MAWVTLEDCEVVHTTAAAVLLEKGGERVWAPRKVMLDGDTIVKGDTDLVIQDWFAKREGLE